MPLILSCFRFFNIGFCALALLLETRLLRGVPLSPGFLDGYIFGGTLFGYHCTHPDWRFRWLAWLFGLTAGICLMSWELAGGNMLAAIAPIFFWLAYYGFRRPGNTGLRAWLLAKPFTIALVWTWVTVFLPVSIKFWGNTQLMFLERYAFIFTLAFSYDVSDLGYDRRAGFSTLASKMTLKSNFSLIFIGLGLSALCVGLSFAKGYYDPFSVIPLFISLIFSAWWIFFLLHQPAWQAWHKVLIDGLMPLQCALVLLLRFVIMK